MNELPFSPIAYETVKVDATGAVIARPANTARSFVEPRAGLELVEIPAGRFTIGAPPSQGGDDERPQHLVAVAGFCMGRGLVTQAQWLAVMGKRLSWRFSGDALPVDNVAWDEAQAFCAKLSRRTGRTYRLPSEAQWEYACRAGSSTPFAYGETLTGDLANYCAAHVYRAEPAGVYRHTTTPAGAFPPNAFGLYDLHGNLWEWCADAWHADYSGAPAGDAPWIAGGDSAAHPVRGGSWHEVPAACRSAARARYDGGQGDDLVGFRVVC